MGTKILNYFYAFLFVTCLISCQSSKQYDVVVVGGGVSGTTAAVQSARLNTKTLLVERYSWLGGMLTMAGVSAVDGNYHLRSGLWGEFLNGLVKHYGSLKALQTAWVSNVMFEPSVGNNIFQQWVKAEKSLTYQPETTVSNILRLKNGWKVTLNHQGKTETVKTTYLIDATELGDVAKQVGLPYSVGMDASSTTGEPQAPEKAMNIVQDITFAMTLKSFDKPQSIAKPAGYDPMEFCNTCINKYNKDIKSDEKPVSAEMMLTYGKLPNHKYMINWPPYGNDIYLNDVDYTVAQRDSMEKVAKAKTIRFLYFLQHELGYNKLGLADDEYPTADKLPFIPYYREGRRFKGLVQFTLNDILTPYTRPNPVYRTAIAVGDYPVDHHHNQYKGKDLPDIHFPKIPSFSLPLGTLIPQNENHLILAEKSISVSNLANGTTRLQPVSMQIGQAAGALAGLAAKKHCAPKDVPVHDVQAVLLNAGTYLMPFLDVDSKDATFKPLQRIGVMGILQGKGKPVNWCNETWLRADSLLLHSELTGLQTVYPKLQLSDVSGTPVSLDELSQLISTVMNQNRMKQVDMTQQVNEIFKSFNLGSPSAVKYVTRKQMAVLVDQLLHPFENVGVDMYGKFIY